MTPLWELAKMNALVSQNFKAKMASLSFPKLISSVAILEEDPPFIETNENARKGPAPVVDPFHFFSIYARTTERTVENTRIMHAHLLKSALLHSDAFVSNSLLHWYCKPGAVVHAAKLFDAMPERNVISWNIMISGFNHNFMFEHSLGFFCRMCFMGVKPSEFTYGSVLSASAALQDFVFGKMVYSLTMKNGLYSNGYVRSGMIDLFSKVGNFEDALRVFYDVPCGNVVCWNSIISGAVRNGENWVALDLFSQMYHRSFVPNSFTFSSILAACATLGEIEIGKGVQGKLIKSNVKDVYVETAIVDLYAKCGDIGEAVKEFSRMPILNVVSWTTLISGFVKRDDSASALNLFKEMRKLREEINEFTITSVITACAKPEMIRGATQVHSWILKAGFYFDSVVGAALINMYSRVGSMDLSEMVFKEMKKIKNSGLWAIMISSFAQNHSPHRAIELFQTMLLDGLKPDQVCYSSIFSVMDSLSLGRQIHCHTLKAGFVLDLSVGSSLFTMYSKCGSIEDSYRVFEQIPTGDNVSWASMIAGFAEHGFSDQAFGLFRDLLSRGIRPDQTTLSAILTACSGLHSIQRGKEIHGYALRAGIARDPFVGSALVTMYSRCSALRFSKKVFDMLHKKDQISCSSLVSGYAQNQLLKEAVLLLHEISMSNFAAIDSFMISSVLGAAAVSNKLCIGTQLHAYITKMGLNSDVSVGTSLVTMYSKCGSIEDCSKAFDHIEEPDVVGWTTMIASYAQHGKGLEALSVYDRMIKGGIRPDSVTFVGVLSACSHANLVEEGYFHFNTMTKDFGIQPNNRHYACMVDILCRSGRLKQAEKFIKSMPIEPDPLAWGTLLAACKLHGDVQLGQVAAKKVMDLEPHDAGAYVALSNICADVGRWEEVVGIRSQMKGTGVRKEPGWSFI